MLSIEPDTDGQSWGKEKGGVPRLYIGASMRTPKTLGRLLGDGYLGKVGEGNRFKQAEWLCNTRAQELNANGWYPPKGTGP
jgi:hypothetical protein